MNVAHDRAQRSREHLEKFLLSPQQDQSTPHGFFMVLQHYATEEKWEFDWTAGLKHWWELARTGVVALLGSSGHSYADAPTFVLTERGRALLSGRSPAPHDETKFMRALRGRVSDPDAIALSYVEEAIGAWKAGLNRASAVMLGCACERIVIVLAQSLIASGIHPAAEKLNKLFSGRREPQISEVYTLVRDGLETAADQKRLRAELTKSVVERRLTPIFEHARILRNSSGHPTGDTIGEEEAEAGLLLFPSFHQFAEEVCESLAAAAK